MCGCPNYDVSKNCLNEIFNRSSYKKEGVECAMCRMTIVRTTLNDIRMLFFNDVQ